MPCIVSSVFGYCSELLNASRWFVFCSRYFVWLENVAHLLADNLRPMLLYILEDQHVPTVPQFKLFGFHCPFAIRSLRQEVLWWDGLRWQGECVEYPPMPQQLALVVSVFETRCWVPIFFFGFGHQIFNGKLIPQKNKFHNISFLLGFLAPAETNRKFASIEVVRERIFMYACRQRCVGQVLRVRFLVNWFCS